jgi:16S rRNA (guanine527-N7)-methyltransferase
VSRLPRLARAAEALGQPLSDGQLGSFERLRGLLTEWNRRLNLTAIDDPEGVETLHFVDSIAGLLALPAGPLRVVDVGSGGGLPGLALRIARPCLRLTLLEATGKKCDYLAAAVQGLGLDDPPVEVLNARAEDVGRDPARRESWDAALARGLAPLNVLAELCLPLVGTGGLVVAWKKRPIEDEQRAATRAITILGGRRLAAMPVDLPGLPPDRQLVRLAKERPTPSIYPRRPGMPGKHPIV